VRALQGDLIDQGADLKLLALNEGGEQGGADTGECSAAANRTV
jgi:hypothetical protein